MLTKEKALYQTWLVLKNLDEEEKKLIPSEIMREIEENMERDDSIVIDTNIPIEKQKLDDKTWKMLDKVIKSIERNGQKIQPRVQEKSDSNTDMSYEINSLKEIIEKLRKENEKLPKAKELTEEYRRALKIKDEEIEKLKKQNQILNNYLQKFPRLLRKIFIGNELNLLGNGEK